LFGVKRTFGNGRNGLALNATRSRQDLNSVADAGDWLSRLADFTRHA
jgi:hypothetical protein